MKKTLKGFLHMSICPYTPGDLSLRYRDYTGDKSFKEVMIKPFEIEVDIPDDFDPRPAQIKALQEKQKEAAAAFHAMNTEIMRQIQELQALEMT